MNSIGSVNAKVIELIAKNNSSLPCLVTADSRFVSDLGMDSMDLVETVMMLEDEFGIALDNASALERVKTVKDVATLICQTLAKARTSEFDQKVKTLKSVVNTVEVAASEISGDLSETAAKHVLALLTEDWNASVANRVTNFDVEAMHRNVGEVIDILRGVQAGLTGAPNAESQMRMHLGLDLPEPVPFDSNSFDDQMAWVMVVRKSYPHIGPKEAFRLAEQEYFECKGVLPREEVEA